MDKFNRAVRRHHEKRLKQRARKKWQWDYSKRCIGILFNTPCTCSCHMCGNPRKFDGNGAKDVQEVCDIQMCKSEGFRFVVKC